jgi:hypothetical protein
METAAAPQTAHGWTISRWALAQPPSSREGTLGHPARCFRRLAGHLLRALSAMNRLSTLSRPARQWIGTLAGAAAAGIWSIHDSFHGAARVALAALAGAGVALMFIILRDLSRPQS